MDGGLNEVLAWKLIGVACWHCAVFLLVSPVCLWALAATPALLSVRGLLRALVLYSVQLLVVYAHRRILSASEVPPYIKPKYGLRSNSLAAVFLGRAVLRHRNWLDWASLLAFYGSCVLSGAVTLLVLHAGGHQNGE